MFVAHGCTAGFYAGVGRLLGVLKVSICFIGSSRRVLQIYLTTLTTLPIKNFQHLKIKTDEAIFLEIFAIVSSASDTNTDVKFIENGCDILPLFVCILENP